MKLGVYGSKYNKYRLNDAINHMKNNKINMIELPVYKYGFGDPNISNTTKLMHP